METFNLLVTTHHAHGQCLTHIRACIYNTCAMPGDPNYFLQDFMNRVNCITVPPALHSFFKKFIEEINRPQNLETPSIILLS